MEKTRKFNLCIYLCIFLFSLVVLGERTALPAVDSSPVAVSMIWNPENFDQWYAIQYVRELINRFGSLISVHIFYAVDSGETQRQLLMYRKGLSTLLAYTQGRILIPSQYWEDSAQYAGISPEEIEAELNAGKGKDAFTNQNIPLQLSREYKKRKQPVLMVSGKIFPGAPSLTGWAEFINKFLPVSKKQEFPAQPVSTEKPEKETIKLLIIEDTKHFSGSADEYVLTMLRNLGMEPEVQRVEARTPEGKKYIRKLQAENLPLYVFDKSIKNSYIFEKLTDLKVITQRKKYYLLDLENTNVLLIKRERIPKNLKLFVMSECPFGTAAENIIFNGIKEGSIPGDISVDIHYILQVTTIPSRPFISLHGNAEWEEAARQKIIQKYFIDEFIEYLMIRNKTPDSSLWDAAAEHAGIDPEFIRQRFDEGKEELAEDAKLVKDLGIHASPTFLWENRELLIGIKSLTEIEEFKSIIEIPEITVEALKEKIEKEDDIFIVDIRDSEGYEEAHIPGSVSIPLQDMELRKDELPDDREVIIVCYGGECAKIGALTLLKSLNLKLKKISFLAGGMDEWLQKNYPVE